MRHDPSRGPAPLPGPDRGTGRIEALGDACLDSHAYRSGVLGELQVIVGHEAWIWPLADPVRTVGIAPMAPGPFAGELPARTSLR